MRALRDAYPLASLAERSARIVERLSALECFVAARAVALFWPLPREVDVRELDVRARAAGKRVYYPVLDPIPSGFSTGFARVDDVSELSPRSQAFHEPKEHAPRAARGEIDLVVVPALALSANGHRLGYGSGFYDATLPDFKPPATSVVVGYDFQLLAELPELEHDVASDFVITDSQLIDVRAEPAAPRPLRR
jgi:5-formyltetrahydrofolate cyclo-ligase